jgi:hypothetical protein
MKCANCHQEILEDNPSECPYCYSKNLIPMEDKFPDGFDPAKPELTQAQRSSIYEETNHKQTILAALGFVMLFSGISLILYGSTLPGNITIGVQYGHPSRINILGFIGLLLVGFSLYCWLYWVFQHIRKK